MIKNELATDKGMSELNRILDVLYSVNENFDEALDELTSFFCRHFKTGLLPVTPKTKFSFPEQQQVYTWLTSRYDSFCNFLNKISFPVTKSTSKCFQELLTADPNKTLIPAAANVYSNNGIFTDNPVVTSIPEFQEAVYSKVAEMLPEHQDPAFQVLTNEFPNSHPSSKFSDLFLKYVSSPIPESSVIQILIHFDAILNRVDNKLITYDFLRRQFESNSLLSSLSLPFLVSVAQDSAVDSPNFYQIAFESISPLSLSSPNRAQYLATLVRVLCPKTRPAQEVRSFATKLSRMLPLVPPDAQLDILSVLQSVVRAHDCVRDLLSPVQTDKNVADVYKNLNECGAETLWEVSAMRSSQVTVVAEEAKTLGQRWVPPDFCSFGLEEAVEAVKPRPRGAERAGNWMYNLDQSVWNFH